MPSQIAIQLQADLAAVQSQINVLTSQPTLVPTSLDGQSFDPVTALDKLYALKERIMVRIRKELPYEIITKNY